MTDDMSKGNYTLPPLQSHNSYRIVLLIGSFLFLLLLISAGILLWSKSSVYARWTLNGTKVLAGTFEQRSLYEYSLFGKHEVFLPIEGKLIDYDAKGKYEAAIVLKNDLVEIVIPGNPESVLVSSKNVKGAIDVSADGAKIAYAELTQNEGGSALGSYESYYDPARWNIRIVTVGTKKVEDAGIGYGPRFFEQGGVSYLAFISASSTLTVLPMNGRAYMTLTIPSYGGHGPQISLDGKYISIFDTKMNSYGIFKLGKLSDGFIALQPFPIMRMNNAIAFKNRYAITSSLILAKGQSSSRIYIIDVETGKSSTPFEELFEKPVLEFIPK
jgi:hypothetical protein